jgi:tape measure domain-containing protein
MAGSNFDLSVTIRAKAEQFIAALRSAASSVGQFFTRVTSGSKAPSAGLEDIESSAKDAGGAVQGLGAKFDSLKTKIAGAFAGYVGFQAFKAALVTLFQTGAEFEALERKITALMGSIEEGKRATTWIRDFAKNTPLSIQDVSSAFVQLKAVGIDPMSGALQAVTDQVVKLGGGQEELGRVLSQLTQAWSKQKFEFEDIKTLMENGIPVLDLMAQALGRTSSQVAQMASNGQLGRKEIAALLNEMERGAAGTAANAMDSWSGIVSNLGDSFAQAKDKFVKAGLFDAVKGGLKALQDYLSRVIASGQIEAWGRSVGETIANVVGYVTSAGTAIQGIVSVVRLAFNGFTTGLSVLQLGVTSFVQKVVEAYAWVQEKLGNDESAAKAQKLADSLAEQADRFARSFSDNAKVTQEAWADTVGALEAGKNALVEAMGAGERAADQATRATQATAEAIGTTLPEALGRVDQAAAGVTVTLEGMQGRAETTAEQVQAAFKALGLESQESLQQLADDAKADFERIRDSGVASAADLSAAYAAFAEKATAANNGITPTYVSLQSEVYKTAAAMEAGAVSADTQAKALHASQIAAMTQREAAQESTVANDSMADSMDGAASVAAAMAAHMRALRDELASLSGNALAQFDKQIAALGGRLASATDATGTFRIETRGVSAEQVELAAKIEATKDTIATLRNALTKGYTDIGNWFIQTSLAAERMKLRFLEQSEAADILRERLDAVGGANQALIREAQGAIGSMTLLGEEDLSGLRSALADAVARMQQLESSARSALETALQAAQEAGLANNEIELENLKHQELMRELQDQLNEARATGNQQALSDLQRAISLQEQAHQARLRQLQDELTAQQRLNEARSQDPGTPGATGPRPLPVPVPGAPQAPGGGDTLAPLLVAQGATQNNPAPTASTDPRLLAAMTDIAKTMTSQLDTLNATRESFAAGVDSMLVLASRPISVQIDGQEMARAMAPKLRTLGALSK